MSYEVLARKWRPENFEEIVGQNAVSQSLKNALSMGRVAHAYLFSGTRGVGKTTTARIFAKALNCAQGQTPTPCGKCDACTEIASGTSVDVIEIDGASNTGVEDVRQLRENVKYSPAKSKHKVYIIDEVHMLSTNAFNALLKTLEEPPAHVVFIFATTDPHKLPATILSRCQHYSFRRVSRELIEAHLKSLCDREGFKAEDAALSRLASLAEGSVRDGLSLLDQMLSYCGSEGVKEELIDDVLGLVGREAVAKAAATILGQDPAGAVQVVDELVDKGHELKRFTATLLEFFRDIMVVKVSSSPGKALDLPQAEIKQLKDMADAASAEEIIRVMNLLTRLADEMKWTANQRISLELAMVKAASRPISSVQDVLAGLGWAKDAGAASAAPAPAAYTPPRNASALKKTRDARQDASYYENPAPAPKPKTRPAASNDGPDVTDDAQHPEETALWAAAARQIKANVAEDDPILNKMAHSVPLGFKGKVFELALKNDFLSYKDDEKALIEETLGAIRGNPVKLNIAGPEKGKGKKSLAEMKTQKEKDAREKALDEALEHPLVKSAMDLFGGEVETGRKDIA